MRNQSTSTISSKIITGELPADIVYQANRVTCYLLAGCLILMASGCGYVPSVDNSTIQLPGHGGPAPIGQETELSSFLKNALSQSKVRFENTPWGDKVTIRAGRLYFAASDRICRKLFVLPDGGSNTSSAIACETPEGAWVPVRAVTDILESREKSY
ncbi:MAG: hypothetical protein KJO08_07205 [Gammaproteobacteria bacterium]|nr:hypothetical protein [Gammaproteobacteria bacterium]NNJ83736.1 hypothetical protein [Gammaproteobacteria bacterium]